MDERARRVGKNEAVFREVNEQIKSLDRTLAPVEQAIEVVCECGDLRCVDQFVVSLTDYERIRSDPTLFMVLPGHERLDVERVTEEHAVYFVVQKHEGEPEHVARETNPRDESAQSNVNQS